LVAAGTLRRAYQLAPGAALGGTLAVQSGSVGGEGAAAWGKSYYHYNDLGTVLPTTSASGAKLGLWNPDFFGNYRWAAAGSPARPEIGQTGKMWDSAAEAYCVNARWYDSERCIFISKSFYSPATEHQYGVFYNDPYNYTDYNGNEPVTIGLGLGIVVNIITRKIGKNMERAASVANCASATANYSRWLNDERLRDHPHYGDLLVQAFEEYRIACTDLCEGAARQLVDAGFDLKRALNVKSAIGTRPAINPLPYGPQPRDLPINPRGTPWGPPIWDGKWANEQYQSMLTYCKYRYMIMIMIIMIWYSIS
jgi:hypothetical protein